MSCETGTRPTVSLIYGYTCSAMRETHPSYFAYHGVDRCMFDILTVFWGERNDVVIRHSIFCLFVSKI